MSSTASPRPPRRRRWRRWRIAVTALAAIAVAIVAALHLPFTRARVLSWLTAELGRQGIRFSADRLSYNLFSLTVALDRVVLSAADAGPPIFEADAVRLDLPFAALRGALHVQSIDVDRPRVRVVRQADGSWNLPRSASTSTSGGPLLGTPLAIDRLVVRNLEVEYTDAVQGVAASGRGISLDLRRVPGQPLAGPLAMSEPATIRHGDRATTLTTIAGQIAFDGETISMTPLELAALEGRTRIAGSVGPFTGDPQMRLDVDAALDVDRVMSWFDLRPPAAGTATVKASLIGPFAAPVAEIASLRAGLGGGDLDASGRVALGSDAPSEASVRWQRVDVGAIAGSIGTLPVRPATISDGDLTLTWTGQDWFGTRGRLQTSFRESADRRNGLALSGRIDASIDDRRWTVRTDLLIASSIAVAGSAGGQLAGDLTASPLDGQTTVVVNDLETALRRLKAAGLDLGAIPVTGTVNAAIDLGGTVAAPRTAATVTASAGPNVITGDVAVDFGTRALSGRFDGDLAQLSALAATVPERWRPDGAGRIGGALSGALDRPVVDVDVAAGSVRIAGETIDSVHATLRVAGGALTITTFEAARDQARLTAAGQYSFADGRYTVNASGTALAIDYAPLRARGDVRLSGSGTIDRPVVTGAIELSRLDFRDYSLAPASAEVMLAAGRLQVGSTLPSLGAQIDGTVDLDTRTISATAAIAGADLSKLASAGPVALAGSVSLRATAAGPLDDVAAMAIGVDLTSADATVNGVPVRLARPATLRHERGQIVATDLEMRLGASTVAVNGRLGTASESLRVDLTGTVDDLVNVARLAPDLAGVNAAGAIALHAEARGPIRTPEVTGTLSLTNGAVSTTDLPPITGIAVSAAVANGQLDVTEIHGRWQGAQVSGTARLPAGMLGLTGASGPATADVRVVGITPEALAPFVDRETLDRISGRIDLNASLQAARFDLDSLAGTVTLDQAAMELARVPIRQTTPTRLRLANRRLDVETWQWTGAGSEIDVSGSVRLDDAGPQLDLGVTGTLDLRMLGAFVPDVAVAGLAKLDVRAVGRAADPEVEGEVAIADTDVILRNPRLAITGLRGDAIFTQRLLQLRDVTAVANGGELRIGGTLDYGSGAPAGGTLTVTGRGMAFEVIDGLRTDVDADLTVALTGADRAIRGRVTILRGDYRRRIRLTDLIGTSRTAAIAPPAAGPGALDAIRLDVAVSSDDDIVVDNNYGRFEVSSQLTVVGTLAEPALAGRLTIRDGGRVFLSGRTYTVRRGNVTFTNPAKIEPQLDLALETRVQQNEITLEVTGTPDAPDVSLRSPGLSQQDAVSLLLTGQRADDSSIAYSEIAQGQLLMLLSGELLGAAGQAIGLDSVQVSRGLGAAASTFDLLSTESNPDARLTLSKNLRRDVELIVSQNLRRTGDITWILAYHPTRRIDLRASTDDQDNRSYEFRHEVPFGGGTRPAAAGAMLTTPPPAPRVARVELRNAPADLAAELRGKLALEAGDRFDFYEWQEDRDRLVRTLRDRSYLEARVAARRQDAAPGTIDVIYEITPGPRTTLEIENFTLPAAAVAEMKAAWADTLFDEFLKEDLTAIAKRALIDAGHLNAGITTTINAAADEKTIVVRVDPGPRFVDRRIEFGGNDGITSTALLEAVRDRDLDVASWQDRAPLVAALVDHYQSLGYLAATVTVAPPQFEGSSAILRVRVDEGPLYRVGDIRVEGAVAAGPADAVATFGLAPGTPYHPAGVEPARRRLEIAHLQRGFNQARVRVAAAPDRSTALVHLTIAIDAGPQQVLESIDISGAQVTSAGVIGRVLKLTVGQPVGLGEVYTAQKRLYDTGVFQSVDLSLVPIAGGTQTAGVQPVRAAVTLRELPRFRLRYGFRIADVAEPAGDLRQIQPGFVTDLLDRNLFGRAIAAGVAGQIEADRALGRAFVSLPTLFRRAVVTNVFVTQSREQIAPEGETAFVDRTLAFTTEQKLKPRAKMAVTYGLSFERKHVYEPNPDPDSLLPPIDLRTNITRATGTYAWDTRDDPSDTTRGWFHSSGVEYGVEALGSDLRFVRYLAQQFFAKRAASRVVFASAIRFGAARGFDQELIPSERFYAGGGTSVRGFAEDGLGPRSILGEPEGGNGLLLFNQEVRVRVHRWFGAVAFVDAGNVFPSAREISLTKLEAGAGAGLRVISPFAILRIDFGVPLTSRAVNPAARWYFGIGHTF